MSTCLLKANIIYTDLSPCGGAERLTLVTMHALYQKGLKFDFTTYTQPDIKKLENAYGNKIASVIKKAEKINILNSLDEPVIERIIEKGNYYDITINTHGDTLPFYHHSLSKNNAVTYCHFPSAKFHINSENLEYLRDIRVGKGLTEVYDMDHSKNKIDPNLNLETRRKLNKYFEFLSVKYDSLMKNTLVLANSDYTRRTIERLFNSHPKILYPPVDVETFREAALKSTQREDMIVIISRIAPDKEIENAIELARIMRDRGIAKKGMVIAGILHHYDDHYHQQLKKMIADYDLSDYVSLQTNISFSKLIQLMQLAKVYFHPRIDEHFGISIAEAMASGLVPIVSDVGGHTEFVPSKYHFHTLDHAAELIALAFKATTDSERLAISNSTSKFSNANYVKSFQRILSELLNHKDIN
ncbi:MAG: glycosyltransferase [Nitrososphaeraceae archaeon]|nr:glycosyltransferase [Nitrososphaeraceae archaeon]